MGPTQVNIPRDYFYGEYEFDIPEPIRIEHGAGGMQAVQEAADLLAAAKFLPNCVLPAAHSRRLPAAR